ncbi:MAG: tail fiber domain-containing protein [Candidatus Paceibacterota bacterium]|jgi:hypothetical protein
MIKFLKNKRIIILLSSIIIVSSFSRIVFSAWDGSAFYNPGDTLNPTCLPGDSSGKCDVLSPLTSTNISNTVYDATTWDGVTTIAPSKDAVRDKIETLATVSHGAVTLGTANGLSLATQVLSLALASTSSTGALSDTDWNIFNNKENVLTFASGLTRTGNTVANDLITGKTGGQTIIGGTAVGDYLIYKSTTGTGTTTGIAHQFIGGTDGGTVAMTILNNGNVGVGTTSPQEELEIKALKPMLRFNRDDSYWWSLGMDNSYSGFSDFILRDESSDVKFMVQAVTGNVGIGNTAPSVGLEVGSNTTGLNAKISSTLGTELITAPMVTGGWTLGYDTGGWTITDGILTKTTSTAALTATAVSGMTSAPVVGTTYKVVITASATSGSITYTLGGVSGTAITATTITDYITAATTAKLIITGAIAGTATITSISVKALTDATGDLTVEGNLKLGSSIQSVNNINAITITPNGNVGIGTGMVSSATKLQVVGDAVFGDTYKTSITGYVGSGEFPTGSYIGSASANSFGILAASGGNVGKTVGVYYYNASQWYSAAEVANVATGYSNLLLMKSGGNVGIGTIVPLALLHISGANQATDGAYNTRGNLFVSSNDAYAINKGGSISLGGYGNTGGTDNTDIYTFARIQGKKETANVGETGGYLAFETDNNASGTLTEKMRITSLGNVGIGTTAPTGKLHVSGADYNVIFDSTSNVYNKISRASTAYDAYTVYQTNAVGKHIIGLTSTLGNDYLQIGGATEATPSMVIDTSGNVGVGTVGPGAKLDVDAGNLPASVTTSFARYHFGYSSSSNTVPSMDFMSTGGTTNYGAIRFPLSSLGTDIDMAFWTSKNNGTFEEKVRILGNGSVGIGTTAPPRILTINKTDNTATGIGTDKTAVIRINNSNTGTPGVFSGIQFGFNASAPDNQVTGAIGSTLTDVTSAWAGALTFATKANSGATVLTEYMRIAAGGNVGIGTTSPAYNLHVNTSDGGASYVTFTNSDTGITSSDGLQIGIDSTEGATLWNRENTYMRFATNNTEQMRILNSGNVGIGTTTPGSSLSVVGTSVNNNGQITIRDSAAMAQNKGGHLSFGFKFSAGGSYANPAEIWGLKENSTDGDYSGYLAFATAVDDGNNIEKMRITSAGLVGIGTSTPTANLQVAQGTAGIGTVSVSDTAVTGVGTQFTNTFKVGDTITVTTTSGSETKAITTITSDTVLVTDAFAGTAAAGTAYTLTGGTRFSVLGNGNVGVGTNTPVGILNTYVSNGSSIVYFDSYTGSSLLNLRSGLDGGVDASGIRLSDSSTIKWTLYKETTNDFYIWNNVANKFPFHLKVGGDITLGEDGGNVGIGTTTPTYKLDVKGTTVASGIRSDMGFDIYQVPNPTAPTGVATAGAGLEIGNYYYRITYTTAVGETGSTASAVITTTAGNQQITLTIPVSTDPRVTGRKIYRTKVGGAINNDYAFTAPKGIVADNTTTTYVDDEPDASLPDPVRVSFYKVNSTTNYFSLNGTRAGVIDANLTAFGISAGTAVTIGGKNAFFGYAAGAANTSGLGNNFFGSQAGNAVTTGGQNVAMGYSSMLYNQTGSSNVAIGNSALYGVSTNSYTGNTAVGASAGQLVTTGDYNTYLGMFSGYSGTTGANGLHLGYYAGKYETAGNKIILDTLDRTTEALGRSSALIYGVTNATPASQILALGGGGKVGIGNIAPDYMLHVGSTSVTDATVLLRLQDADSTCDFTANLGAPACGSDESLKKNVLELTGNLDKVLALRPITYNWLTDTDDTNIKHGFIAQEVATVMPELVTDGIWIDGSTKKFLQMEGMIPYMVGAIKEMNLGLTMPDAPLTETLDGVETKTFAGKFFEKLSAWLANAENKITRIFTGEVCLTEAGEETVCINRAELKSLKALLNQSSGSSSSGSSSSSEPTPQSEPELQPQPEAPQPSAEEGESGQPSTEVVENPPEEILPTEEIPVIETPAEEIITPEPVTEPVIEPVVEPVVETVVETPPVIETPVEIPAE